MGRGQGSGRKRPHDNGDWGRGGGMVGNSGGRGGYGRTDLPFGMAGPNGVGHMRGMVGVPVMGPMRPGMDAAMMIDGMQPRPFGTVPGRGQQGRGSGRGGHRGGGPMRGGCVSGFKRQRFEGLGSEDTRGFPKRGNHGPYPEIYSAISDAVTPQMVLHLWADQGHMWTEQYLAHGLFTFAKLVEETCPDEIHQMRCLPECVSMVDSAKRVVMSMRPTECSKVARAMGKLDLQDEDLCMGLVQGMRSHLLESPPIAVAGVMAGLGQVAYRPAAAILREVEKYVMANSARLTPKDVKDFIVAFTAMEAPPSPEMVNAAILQLPGHFKDTLPKDLSVLVTALRKLDFHPSQPFVIACANFLCTKLEGSIAGALAPSTLEVGTISKLLSGLVGWKFTPPPPMLLMVSRVMMNQMPTASAADVCDILEMFAAAYWHPSGPVLQAIEAKLDSNCGQLPIVSLCTSLWSFAIFAHVPNISFQRTYANRIETDIAQLNAFQLCSVLWVFALFRSCTMGVWNTLVGKLRTFKVSDIDESALRYFFQVYLFIRASASSANLEAYHMPHLLLQEADRAWRRTKREESRQALNEFEVDVKRIVSSMLDIKPVEPKAIINDGLFTVDLWCPSRDVAIMCLGPSKFSINAIPPPAGQGMPVPAPVPLGQTRMMQHLFVACKVPVVLVPQHIWMSLESDSLKRDFLHRHIEAAETDRALM
eukprot:jgi/Ulvmu1/5899/UM026_0020.1